MSNLFNTISTIVTIPTLLLFSLVAVTIHKTHRYFTSPLRHQQIPGPLLAKFTTVYSLYYVLRRNWHLKMIDLHTQYGPIVQVSPHEVLVNDPKYRDVIYSFASKDKSFLPKAKMFETGKINNDLSFIFERSPQAARAGRKELGHIYSEAGLRLFEVDFDQCVEDLITGLKNHHIEAGTESTNLTKWMQFFNFDLATRLATGESAGFCLAGKDLGSANSALRIIMDVVGTLFFVPVTLSITTAWVRKMLLNRQLEQIWATSFDTKGSTKEARLEEIRMNKPGYLLARFWQAQEKLRRLYTTGNETEGITTHMFNLIAGAVGVAPQAHISILDHLLASPPVLQKCITELNAMGTTTVSMADYFPFDGPQQRLPYLQACIKESLRIAPPLGFSLLREAPEGGVRIGEFHIPKGVDIGMAAGPVHHSTFFGPDASLYRPSRWFETHPSLLNLEGEPLEMKRFIERNWIPFGAGARMCLGRHLAQNALMKVTGRMLAEFEIEVVSRPKGWFGFVVHQDGFLVRLKRRRDGDFAVAM
ncbi:cytochrome P450 [Ascobolus immersus RN42]|uniref:Cytochrome P450 n=1 Tax=Ascobolus immersus RN42 TaxID=1160509 RepID=A0A3N4IBZ8_ASCIM|nr:cytochrome P450 [Ascobolus immersus RN42]